MLSSALICIAKRTLTIKHRRSRETGAPGCVAAKVRYAVGQKLLPRLIPEMVTKRYLRSLMKMVSFYLKASSRMTHKNGMSQPTRSRLTDSSKRKNYYNPGKSILMTIIKVLIATNSRKNRAARYV